MNSQTPLQAVVTAKANVDRSTTPVLLCLFKSDGTAFEPLEATDNQMPVQAASTAADVATLKTDFNALLTKLKNAGLMASS